MAFTIEDGTGVTDSNAFCGVTFADDYHADRGSADWKGSKQEKQRAIVRASDFLGRLSYRGKRVDEEQSMAWPRVDVWSEGHELLDPTVIPIQLKRATAELAMIALAQELQPDSVDGRVASETEKAGSMSLTTTFVTDDSPRYQRVMAMLDGLIQSQGQVPLARA